MSPERRGDGDSTREAEALRMREALRAAGLPDGYRSVARALGVAPSTARDLLIRAERRERA